MQRSNSTVAERAALELLYRSKTDELSKLYPQVAVIFVYHWLGVNEGLSAVRELRRHNPRIRGWMDSQAVEKLGIVEAVRRSGLDDWMFERSKYDVDVQDAVEQADCVFIPVLSLSLASRIARLDDSEYTAGIIIQALCKGKPVAAIRTGADCDHAEWTMQGLRPNADMQRIMREQLQTIRGYGVRLLDYEAYRATNIWPTHGGPSAKQVITSQDIQYAADRELSVIHLTERAVITPLARDMAKDKGIEFNQSGHGEDAACKSEK